MRQITVAVLLVLFVSSSPARAQSPDQSVPRLINLTGVFRPADGQPPAAVETVTLAIYADPQGGAPVWQETQTVTIDDRGRYSLLLGATTSGGIPPELFSSLCAQNGSIFLGDVVDPWSTTRHGESSSLCCGIDVKALRVVGAGETQDGLAGEMIRADLPFLPDMRLIVIEPHHGARTLMRLMPVMSILVSPLVDWASQRMETRPISGRLLDWRLARTVIRPRNVSPA